MAPSFEIAIWILVLACVGTAAWAGWKAAPFFPTAKRDVERLLDLADIRPDDLVIDLGCGDGRIVFAAGQRGARAVGYELSIIPYLIAKIRWVLSPVRRRTSVQFKDFWRVDASSATVITAFLLPRSMNEVAARIVPQLRPGTRIVSYAFPIADWQPVKRDKPDSRSLPIWVYRVPG